MNDESEIIREERRILTSPLTGSSQSFFDRQEHIHHLKIARAHQPIQIHPDVFIGQSITQSKELIYLRMELVTADNERSWAQYKASSVLMANSRTRSVLTSIAANIYESKSKDMAQAYFFNNSEGNTVLSRYGFTQFEFQQFINHMGRMGFTPGSKKLDILKLNASGSQFMLTDSFYPKTYIVYASKTPDFLITNVPIGEVTSSIKTFMTNYSDLIMTVGADFSSESTVVNRGMSRNPLSVIDNTYKGIAMTMHGFVASVAKTYFPHMCTMTVKPVGFMQHILCSQLSSADISIDGMTFDDARAQSHACAINPLAHGSEYPVNTIRIDALVSFYEKIHAQHVSTRACAF